MPRDSMKLWYWVIQVMMDRICRFDRYSEKSPRESIILPKPLWYAFIMKLKMS